MAGTSANEGREEMEDAYVSLARARLFTSEPATVIYKKDTGPRGGLLDAGRRDLSRGLTRFEGRIMVEQSSQDDLFGI
ncbi:hypothetical protein Trydic_g23778 [Trypoxylus dichotomus]